MHKLIYSLIWVFAFSGAVVCFPSLANNAPVFQISQYKNSAAVDRRNCKATMGWRYVAYVDEDVSFHLQIEPMVKGSDIVYVPNEATWLKNHPTWTKEKRAEALACLKAVAWNRKLSWPEGDNDLQLGAPAVIRGSLESTAGGKALEDERFFEPGSKVSYEKAHKMWEEGARMMAEQATGRVRVFAHEIIPDSVFQAVELPALLKNPNVTLEFK